MSTEPLPDPASLFAGVDLALFTDIDGTLIELAETPDQVVVSPGLPKTLKRLNQGLGGAVALVTGRRLEDIDRLFGPLPLTAAGQHGLERRDAHGAVTQLPVDRRLMTAIADKLRDFAARHPGTEVEDKGLTIALHYRNAVDAEQPARRFVSDALHGLGGALSLHDGKKVLEVKPHGVDKGTAVRDMMGAQPFAGRMPVFIGDDVTDEDGFAVVNDLGGISIEVGHREPTVAQYRIADVDASLALLTWIAAREAAPQSIGATS